MSKKAITDFKVGDQVRTCISHNIGTNIPSKLNKTCNKNCKNIYIIKEINIKWGQFVLDRLPLDVGSGNKNIHWTWFKSIRKSPIKYKSRLNLIIESL